MATKISALVKDNSFKDDDYLIKDGEEHGTRTISVQEAADGLVGRSSVGLKRASSYGEATTITEGDYFIKDNTTNPSRISPTNLATELAQLATYPDGESIGVDDYILKVSSNGIQKISAQNAAGDIYELAGEMAGAEMLEEAIANGIVDQAMENAITETVPAAVDALRSEIVQGTTSTAIVDGAYDRYSNDTEVALTDYFLKRNTSQGATTVVTPTQIADSINTYLVQNADPTDIPAATLEYMFTHIPFDKNNVDETTVDGQLRAALFSLGILDDVAT